MRALHLALIAALLAPASAGAQSAAQQMLDMAKQIRTSAEQQRKHLPADAYAQMIEQAAEIERSVAAGDFAGVATPKKEPTNAERIMAEHGRLDWLMGKPACAGYTLENYSTFRFDRAINDRDSHCRNAFGHYAAYLNWTRDPKGAEAAETSLFYYDAAARRAVQHHGGQ